VTRRARRCALALAALWSLAGCGPSRAPANAPPIVLVSLDTLRADALTPYGYVRPTSPALARFAREAVRFEQAHAHATATLPSHLSLFTSLYPPQLGITRNDGHNETQAKTRLRLPDAAFTLAEALQEKGYRTLGFADGGFVHPFYGMDQGFDRFELATGPGLYWNQLPRTLERIEAALAAREQRGEREPLFLFVHCYDIHEPYSAAPRFERRFSAGTYLEFEAKRGFAARPALLSRHRAELTPDDVAWARGLYDNGVRATDAAMAGLFALLRRHGLYDGALIAILSDHGEEFLDHGDFGHGPRVYQELARVPWLLRLPGARQAGRVIAAPVGLVDVAPTLLDLAGLPLPQAFGGRSLRGVIEGTDAGAWLEQRPLLIEAPDARLGALALRLGREKLVLPRREGPAELYDLRDDPGETRDLAAAQPERTAQLRSELETWVAELQRQGARAGTLAVPNEEPNPARGALEALGYVDD
jgi:arylsulfatase A-like enzyme